MRALAEFNFLSDEAPWWLPCPRTCKYNMGGACWCDAQSDRLSASLVSRDHMPRAEPRELPGAAIPVYSLADSQGVGFVFAPRHTSVLCSYVGDAFSYNVQCSPPGTSRTCVPGCMATKGEWSWGAYQGAGGLKQMLRAFESVSVGTYNEVRDRRSNSTGA